jgi:septum formation protein
MIDSAHPLLLGSASPRRWQLLETLGLPLSRVVVEVDEDPRPGEPVDVYLERIVADKLAAVGTTSAVAGCGAVLVADTAVVQDGTLLGKPRDDAEATSMIRALAGRQHEVRTRFALAAPERPTAAAHAETVVTLVRFRALDDDEVARYVATGEGRDKAGGYAVQGIGGFAVDRIEGSYSNVVGLPVCEVVLALRRTGLLGAFPLS